VRENTGKYKGLPSEKVILGIPIKIFCPKLFRLIE
jgi:hypothetical protein